MAIWLMVNQMSKYATFVIFHKATGGLKIVYHVFSEDFWVKLG